MPKRTGELTHKEMKFCEEYVKTQNATRAYLNAYGSSYDTANAQGYIVLKRPNVKKHIAELQKESFEAACITAEAVALKLKEIAFAEKGDIDYNATAQLKALDLLQKQLGLQKQVLDAQISNEINITIEE
jgi:phage terminase small subunit